MKAQIWSMDFLMSVFVFIIALGMLVFAWNYTSARILQQNEAGPAENTVIMVSDSLVRTAGIPENWEPSTVTSVGLAQGENVLNITKVDMFINMSYEYVKTLMGLERYNFYFTVKRLDGTVMKNAQGQNLTAGQYPQDSEIVVPMERYVMYNGEPAKLGLIIWF